MTAVATAAALAANPWLIAQSPLVKLPLVGSPDPVLLDSRRFGRRFTPFSYLLREARLNRRQSEADLAKLIGKDRSLVCRLEGPKQDKIHASPAIIFQLAIGLGLEPLEAYMAYLSEVRPEFRIMAYPDDPGPAGRAFGLPIAGFQSRIASPRP